MNYAKSAKIFTSRTEQLGLQKDKAESYSRNNNTTICGIPNKEDETSIEVATVVCESAGVKSEFHKVEAARRYPQRKKTSTPPFILRPVVSRNEKI